MKMVSVEDLATRDAAIEQIAAKLGVRAERGKRFAELTSLRVGGAIDWVLSPQTEEQAAIFAKKAVERVPCSGDRHQRIMGWLLPRLSKP